MIFVIPKCYKSTYKFGTKQAYPLNDKNYTPLQKYLTTTSTVHAVFRHGFRYPKTSHMNRFQAAFPNHKFRWDKINDSMKLSKVGWQEHIRNGMIYKNFTNNCTVKSSWKSRSVDSAKAFIQGADMKNDFIEINTEMARYIS